MSLVTFESTTRRRMPSWLPQALGYTLSAVCLFWVLRGYDFNKLANDFGRYAGRLEAFASEFSAILSRQLDERP